MNGFQRVAQAVNTLVRPILESSVGTKLFGSSMTTVTYVGRRSGKTVTVPIAYRRTGDEVTIGVAMPDRKTWWRNFTGEGAPITVRIKGVDEQGHAVAHRSAEGEVSVRVKLGQ